MTFDNNNRIVGKTYDASGNITNDGVHSYSYDAENRIIKVDNQTAYLYDGEGRRVRKFVGEDTRFIYGIGSELLAEITVSEKDGDSLLKEYVYAGGSLITIEPSAGTQYATSDHLGSPRVITNSVGNVVSRHDYLPFGEEIQSGTGGRNSAQGYGGQDSIRQKFTQKERDIDTGLDYFGARYYAPSLGRFTGADNVAYSKTEDPQTWNQYAYCRNGPLVRIDPDGHNWFFVTRDGKDYWEWYD
jgi:RHS repeat-associated protein